MDIYYINHQGRKIDFMNGCYSVESSSLFEHKWGYESTDAGYGGKIDEFKKGIQEKKIQIHIESVGLISCEKAYDTLIDCIETDVLHKKPGILYVDSYYLQCYLVENKPVYMVPGIGSATYEFGIVSERSFWIKEESYYIPPVDIEGLLEINSVPASLENTHFTDCHFLLKAYGPLKELFFYVNDNQYRIVTPCEEGEYLILDTRNETIVKVDASGNQTNVYSTQVFSLDNFKKIPAGENTLRYKRDYAIEITLFHERSEPKQHETSPDTYYAIMAEYGCPLTTEDGYLLLGEETVGGA